MVLVWARRVATAIPLGQPFMDTVDGRLLGLTGIV